MSLRGQVAVLVAIVVFVIILFSLDWTGVRM